MHILKLDQIGMLQLLNTAKIGFLYVQLLQKYYIFYNTLHQIDQSQHLLKLEFHIHFAVDYFFYIFSHPNIHLLQQLND